MTIKLTKVKNFRLLLQQFDSSGRCRQNNWTGETGRWSQIDCNKQKSETN